MNKVTKIPKGTKTNFNTLCKAVIADDVCLLDAQDARTGESVVLVCAVNWGDGEAQFVPLAVMISGNPYEQFNPPNVEGGYYTTEKVAH